MIGVPSKEVLTALRASLGTVPVNLGAPDAQQALRALADGLAWLDEAIAEADTEAPS